MGTERVSVPDVLAKPRDHAVICTFGADLAFYEGPLWRHIARARNRVVLADELMLARQLSDLAAGGSRLRHVNINYLVSPITNPRSAHAKLILLTDTTGGTLLVGSGNVSIDGYASRGEALCRYDISGDDTRHLGAFQAAKDFLDTMAARGYLDTQAIQHLECMWSDTPWIWTQPAAAVQTVRHNLNTPLAEQLIAFVGGEVATDVVMHAPFHDPDCEALRRLLTSLKPEHATVVVQERRTSVDPSALAHVLETCPARTDVLLAAAPGFPATYLHAKFILIRTPARSVTFVGSANLSLAALYRTDRPAGNSPPGNIELVNLMDGPPRAFDDFLAGLDLTEPTSQPAELDVSYHRDEENEKDDARPQLRRGVWHDGVLHLEAAHPLPEGPLTLVIAGTDAPAALAVNAETVSGQPSPEAAAILDSKAVPVWLRIGTPDGPVETTPVYPYHLASLASMLTGRRDPDLLRKTGSLDLEADDEDLTALLDELDAALIIDRQSVWRLAGRSVPAENGDSDGPRLRWEDLDFDALRHHPKLAQYHSALGRRTDRPEATDLQVILAAIAEHFHGIGQQRPPGGEPAGSPGGSALDVDVDDLPGILPSDRDDTPGDESPEEIEAEDQKDAGEREHRRLQIETRNRLAWQRFCDRFMRGLRDPEFIDLVGPSVAVANAVIFNHLLALLITKSVVAADRGITCQLQLWTFLWGAQDQAGYLGTLDEDTRLDAMEAIAERGGEVTVLAAVHLADQLTRSNGWTQLRTGLRDMWRHLLESPLLTFTADVLRRAASPGGRPAVDISRELDKLARLWTTPELHAVLAACLGTTAGRIRVTRGRIRRRLRDEMVDILLVDDPAASLDTDRVPAAFAAWAALDQDRAYFRFEQPATSIVAVWDLPFRECWIFSRHADVDPVTLEEPAAAEPAWSTESRKLLSAARVADRIAA
jgi:hypothetical protein